MKKHNLEIKKINFARSGRQILENISFSIFSGELLVVTGPNGSGKTTLLRLISGLLQLNEGSISPRQSSDKQFSKFNKSWSYSLFGT